MSSAVRGTTRFNDPPGTKGIGELAIIGIAAHRQRGLSRDGHAGPLVADLYREGARTRVPQSAHQFAIRRTLHDEIYGAKPKKALRSNTPT